MFIPYGIEAQNLFKGIIVFDTVGLFLPLCIFRFTSRSL
jgi:hypothetical protein